MRGSMTREEAIAILIRVQADTEEVNEALDMAVNALEQEPCEDAISMSVIEDIKAEINEFIKNPQFGDLSIGASCGAVRCLEIINKHINGKEKE